MSVSWTEIRFSTWGVTFSLFLYWYWHWRMHDTILRRPSLPCIDYTPNKFHTISRLVNRSIFFFSWAPCLELEELHFPVALATPPWHVFVLEEKIYPPIATYLRMLKVYLALSIFCSFMSCLESVATRLGHVSRTVEHPMSTLALHVLCTYYLHVTACSGCMYYMYCLNCHFRSWFLGSSDNQISRYTKQP